MGIQHALGIRQRAAGRCGYRRNARRLDQHSK
jgi:hypothetical protein